MLSARVILAHIFTTFLVTLLLVTFAGAGPLKRPASIQQTTPKDGLSSEMVYAIGIQGEEVWFGTEGGGVTLYDKSKKIYRAYTTKGEPMDKLDDGKSINWKNLLAYNHVSVIVPDADRIWFGTYFYGFGGGGISYYQAKRNPPWKRFNTNDGRAKKVVSMAVGGDEVWVGSEKGVSLLDKKTEGWRLFYSTQDGLSGNFVNSLLIQSGFIWMGTNGGISRFDKVNKTWKAYSQKDGLTEAEVKSLAIVKGKIWAGGLGGSLSEYDAASDRWKRVDPSDGLKSGGIHSMTATRENVFICRDNGVSVCDLATGKWEALTVSDGLLSNNVFCAAEDRNSIWFGTDKGVSRLILTP